jgi:hypothetical protein
MAQALHMGEGMGTPRAASSVPVGPSRRVITAMVIAQIVSSTRPSNGLTTTIHLEENS